MNAALTTTSASSMWYFSRATGVVTLGLLTLVVLLGVLTRGGRPLPGLPRFAVAGLHRNASLLTVVMLTLHVGTSILDGYAPIGLADAVIPFVSAYRPLWLGLGALALDMLVAVVVTSLLRLRLGARAWKAVHWLAYAVWPVALVHGLGTGTDAAQKWMLAFTAGCVGLVALAVVWRVLDVPGVSGARRALVLSAVAVAPVVLIVWLSAGPLASHWARRAGTPSSLLAASTTLPAAATTGTSTGSSGGTGSAPAAGAPRGQVSLAGTVGETSNGEDATITLNGSVGGDVSGSVEIRLRGTRLDDGRDGVALSSGSVTLTIASGAGYTGAVDSLNENRIGATLSGPAGSTNLVAVVRIDRAAGHFTGTATLL